jgi:large subunit ribosomal protein L17
MPHKISGRHLHRRSEQRILMLRNLAVALITHESIETTEAKAKELRRFLEPMITRSKVDSVAHRRLIFSRLRNADAVHKLFTEIGPRSQTRPGGYLRVLKYDFRQNDGAPTAIVQWVDRVVEESKA